MSHADFVVWWIEVKAVRWQHIQNFTEVIRTRNSQIIDAQILLVNTVCEKITTRRICQNWTTVVAQRIGYNEIASSV